MDSSEQIVALTKEMGVATPEIAVRERARQLVNEYHLAFNNSEVPIDVLALASFRGIRTSNEPPALSEDAELVPDEKGVVTMRVNPDQPETRQRFSVAHEVSHTFFPQYSNKIQCRTDARHRSRHDSDDLLETLCDIGASEILFPYAAFAEDVSSTETIDDLVNLILKYRSSREATMRHFAEVNSHPVSAIFFEWKLKPTQKKAIGPLDQMSMFNIDPQEEMRQARMLRIDYAIGSSEFNAKGYYLPKDKSIVGDGPILDTARQGICTQGDADLDFGSCRGKFRIRAVPLYTSKENQGPNGEVAVAAIIEPLEVRTIKQNTSTGPRLFDLE